MVISGPFTSSTRLRFRCDASGNSDWVYIDDVEILGCLNGSGLPESGDEPIYQEEVENIYRLDDIMLFPNPVNDRLNLTFTANHEASVRIQILNISGHVIKTESFIPLKGRNEHWIDLDQLGNGMYLIRITNEGYGSVRKFIVSK